MINIEFQEAANEVLDILSHMKTEDIERIPKKFREFLEENSSKTYKVEIDYTKPIEEAKLKQKTYDLLATIYLNYWVNSEEEKVEYIKKLNENERKYQEELREKYNPDNIFKNKNIKVEETPKKEEIALVEYKESIFRKILNKIRYIFKK